MVEHWNSDCGTVWWNSDGGIVLVEKFGGTVWWNSVVEKWNSVVKQWNSHGGTVWWNTDGGIVRSKSASVMVEQCGGTVEQ